MKPPRNLRTTGGLLVMANKPHSSLRFNPAPDERIEPGCSHIAMGEAARSVQIEAISSFFMKVGVR
jgi:hypothetical protein